MTSFPVICGLATPIKNLGYACGYNGYLPPVTVTSEVRLIRRGTIIAWLSGRGRNKFWGGTRSLFVWIWERNAGTRNLSQSRSNEQGKDQKKKVFNEIQRDFSAEIRNSTVFFGRKQVISKKKGLHWNSEGFSGRNQKFKQFFQPKTGDYPPQKGLHLDNFMKSDLSPQKLGN